jgi:PEP-CTERM motif
MKMITSSSICVVRNRRTLFPAMVTGAVTVVVWGMSAGMAFAAAAASDSASNYVSVWGTSAPNNGSGFGNWGFTGGPNSGDYSTFLAGVANTPIVDTGGNAWAINVESVPLPGFLSIVRTFTPGPSASSALFNQTITFDLAVSGVPSPSSGGPAGYFAADVGSLEFGFQEDGPFTPYTFLINSTSNTDYYPLISASQWTAGLVVSISVSGALASPTESYTLMVSPFSGGGPIYSNSGTFDSSRFVPSEVNFVATGFDGDGYFNSINISPEPVPEPSGVALVGFGIGLAGAMRRMWKRD